MERIVYKYLDYLKIPLSHNFFVELLLSHPEYPSLLSISDVLERLGINHKIVRVEKKNITDLVFPYLLQLDKKGAELNLIKNQKELTSAVETESVYCQFIILKVESTGVIADKENEKWRSKETFLKIQSAIFISAAIALIFSANINFFSWIHVLLLITTMGGILVGYLLIAKDLGINYEVVEAFCKAGKNSNCDEILKSEDAKLFGRIRFSDAAVSFFVFQLIVVGLLIPLLNTNGAASFLWVLSIFSTLSIPIIGYSIYYQFIRASSWCRLCIIVDMILAFQVGIFSYLYYEGIIQMGDGNLQIFLVSIMLFTVISSFLLLIKANIMKDEESIQAGIKAKRIKNSITVFSHLLFQEKRVEISSFDDKELFVGDPNAPLKIIVASDLYCKPCKIQHEKAKQLVAAYPEKACIIIRLQSRQDDNRAARYIFQYWLNNIYGEADESSQINKLLHDWYNGMDIEKFMNHYQLDNSVGNKVNENFVVKHTEWFRQEQIYATPTFFINGYKLPANYNIADMMALIPSVVELFQNKEKSCLQNLASQ
ncbi:Thioredoxin [Fodinibius roseus]|uniref:Thioredoxin n=1 Tax=Fodinibius roseus TaxID=1194090 RepID=A0A1M5IN45_9BACT|nr:vitamin K epoxide reductase family protein [Fodinibius roseus]SHG29666.1 Thioredoxin [Fodinibius roseus]